MELDIIASQGGIYENSTQIFMHPCVLRDPFVSRMDDLSGFLGKLQELVEFPEEARVLVDELMLESNVILKILSILQNPESGGEGELVFELLRLIYSIVVLTTNEEDTVKDNDSILLNLPMLWTVGELDKKEVWAAKVLSLDNSTAVLETLKGVDGTDELERMIDLIRGDWSGVRDEPFESKLKSSLLGSSLESWKDTTLSALALYAGGRGIQFGLGAGGAATFISARVSDLKVIEPSYKATAIARDMFGCSIPVLNESPLDYLSTSNPDFVLINCSEHDEWFTSILDGSLFRLALSKTKLVAFSLMAKSQRTRDQVMHVFTQVFPEAIEYAEYHLREGEISKIILGSTFEMSIEGWQRRFSCVTGSMDVSKAQLTSAIRVPKVLTSDDIVELRKFSASGTFGREDRGAEWWVHHLHTNGQFQRMMSHIRDKLIEAARLVDSQHWGLLDDNDISVRVAEFHRMGTRGTLGDSRHYDQDSIITIDVMLSDSSEYEGGHLRTEELDGSFVTPKFEQGDAVVFVSHKYHCVSEVTRGIRNVLVLELWRGPERECGHRCETFGDCPLEGISRGTLINDSLPFRLGAISDDAGIQRLLWQPIKSSQVHAKAMDSEDEAWDIFS